jgi:hypothetical protein
VPRRRTTTLNLDFREELDRRAAVWLMERGQPIGKLFEVGPTYMATARETLEFWATQNDT